MRNPLYVAASLSAPEKVLPLSHAPTVDGGPGTGSTLLLSPEQLFLPPLVGEVIPDTKNPCIDPFGANYVRSGVIGDGAKRPIGVITDNTNAFPTIIQGR